MIRCLNCLSEYDDSELICPRCAFNSDRKAELEGRLEPGTVIAERFRLDYVIKKDGFGFTYSAFDLKEESRVAVKEYMPSGVSEREPGGKRVRFIAECEKYAQKVGEIISFADRLKKFDYYEAIPGIIDFGLENDTAYVILEADDGETIQEIVSRDGCYNYRNTVADISPVVRAVDGLHREGLVHGNITPENIMICASGKVKLTGFSLLFSDCRESSSPFIAPETVYDNALPTPAGDIFSICAVIFYMLTGKEPQVAQEGFEPYIDLSASVDLPDDAYPAVKKGLSADPDERPKDAEDILNALIGKKVFRLEKNLNMPTETQEAEGAVKTKSVNKPLLIVSVITAVLGICFIALSIKFIRVIKANNVNESSRFTAEDLRTSSAAADESPSVILPAEAKNIYLDFLRNREFTLNYKTAYAVRAKDAEMYSESEPLPPGVKDLDRARFSEYYYDIDSDGVNECILITDLDGGFEYITLYIFDIDADKNVFEGGRIVCDNGLSEDLRLCTVRAGNSSAYYFLRFTVDAFEESSVNSNSFESLYYNGRELVCVASAGADKYSEDTASGFSYTGSELTPDGDIWDPEDPYAQRSLYVYDDDRYVHSPDEYVVIDSDTFNLIWMRNVVSAYTKVLIKSAERGNTGVQVSIMFPGIELDAKDIQLERRTPGGNEVFLYTADGRPLQFIKTLSKKDFREPYKVEIYYDDARYVSCTITLDNDGNPVYSQGEPELLKVPDVIGMRRERAISAVQAEGFENVRAVNGGSRGLRGLFNMGKVERVNVAVGEYYPRDTEIIIYTSM